MAFDLILLAAVAGVIAALGGVYASYKRRKKAERDWKEFNRDREL